MGRLFLILALALILVVGSLEVSARSRGNRSAARLQRDIAACKKTCRKCADTACRWKCKRQCKHQISVTTGTDDSTETPTRIPAARCNKFCTRKCRGDEGCLTTCRQRCAGDGRGAPRSPLRCKISCLRNCAVNETCQATCFQKCPSAVPRTRHGVHRAFRPTRGGIIPAFCKKSCKDDCNQTLQCRAVCFQSCDVGREGIRCRKACKASLRCVYSECTTCTTTCLNNVSECLREQCADVCEGEATDGMPGSRKMDKACRKCRIRCKKDEPEKNEEEESASVAK